MEQARLLLRKKSYDDYNRKCLNERYEALKQHYDNYNSMEIDLKETENIIQKLIDDIKELESKLLIST